MKIPLYSAKFVPLALAGLALLAATADAQWGAASLHPVGPTNSSGAGGNALQQVGSTSDAAGVVHAAMWAGSAASWVDLNPIGATSSECTDVDGSQQVGFSQVNGNEYAMLWSGSAASAVNLHPPGPATFSRVWGAGGGKQVGYVQASGFNADACMWSGSAASFVSLKPAGSTFSVARDSAGNQQVGQAYLLSFGTTHAGIWTGSAASWVDLHPPALGLSQAIATDGVQQVGRGIANAITRACLWSGSAASFIDLTPMNASQAEALAVDGGEQVGWGNMPFQNSHAYFWAGSASSWVDLHRALSPDYASSVATGIWHAGGRTWVVGKAYNATLGRAETILWWSLRFESYCAGKVNSAGCTPTIATLGAWSSATSANGFYIRANNALNNVNGLMIYGASGRDTAPFAGGTMCVANPRMRGVPLNSGGANPPTVNCSGAFVMDMHAFRDGLLGGSPAAFLALPGTLVDCQYWGRDPGFVPPFNAQLSNALEFEIGP